MVKNQQDADGFDIVLSKKKVQNTAAPENLFKVNESSEKLNKECSKAFHHIVAKALYITKQARPDLCVAIAFLTTRVRDPTVEDWKKLYHMICYLRATEDMILTLGGFGVNVLK